MMKKDIFEQYIVTFGPDLACWPADLQAAAQLYVQSSEGARVLAEEKALTTMFETAKAETDSAEHFLARLERIPALHLQNPAKQSFLSKLQFLILPADSAFSPARLISQAAVFAIVLGLGVMTGMSGLELDPAQTQEVDISDGWFALTLEIDGTDDALGSN